MPKAFHLANIVVMIGLALSVEVHAQQAPHPLEASSVSRAQEIAPLELVVLGSGGPGATGRAASSYLVLLDGVPRILVDAGPGSFVRLGESKLSLSKVDIVLLTHLHIDHVGELPGIFKARAVSGSGAADIQIFGPQGSSRRMAKRAHVDDEGSTDFPSTTHMIDSLFGKRGIYSYLRDFAAPLDFHAQDLSTDLGAAPKEIVVLGDLRIEEIAGHHRDAPAIIYRVNYRGKSITFSGDIDAHGIPNLKRLAKGTSLLVFNSVVLDPPGSPEVLYSLHTPPEVIGAVAGGDNVDSLLLSHISPAIEAREEQVLESIRKGYAKDVNFAVDGSRWIAK